MQRVPTRPAVLKELERVGEQLAAVKTSRQQRLVLLRRQAQLGDLRDAVVRPAPRRSP